MRGRESGNRVCYMGWVGRDLEQGSSRHLAGVFCRAFLLVDEVVDGEPFCDWARHTRDKYTREKRTEKVTRTPKTTRLPDMLVWLKVDLSAGGRKSSAMLWFGMR